MPPSHHTKDKGDLAVAKVLADLSERRTCVLLPFTEHAPFDLVALLDGHFYRVQVKYRSATNGSVAVHFRSTWADRHGIHSRPMARDEVDVVAIYCPDTGQVYYLNPGDFGSSIALRIAPRNSQSRRVRLAVDFMTMPPIPAHQLARALFDDAEESSSAGDDAA